MTCVRVLLACVHLLQLWACEVLTDCCSSCLRRVSRFTSLMYAGFVTGLIEPSWNLCIVFKGLCVLFWKFAFTICTVPWRLCNLVYTWFTASCSMLSRCLSLLGVIPSACLALLCQIYRQKQEAVLQLLWSGTPGWIQTTCTALAQFWYCTGKEDPAHAPSKPSSFSGFSMLRLINRAPDQLFGPSPGRPVCLFSTALQ